MGKVKWFALGMFLSLVLIGRPIFAQGGVDVMLNGQQHGAVMTQGDTLWWQITLPPGGTSANEIWVDLNNNNRIDPDSDMVLFKFSQTDGEMGDPPDMDGMVNGQIYLRIKAGLAPAHYLMAATVGMDSDTSDVTVNPLPQPAFTVSGKVTVPPGVSPANLYLQAEMEADTSMVFWAALTDSAGNYTIAFDSTATGSEWKIRFEGNALPQYIPVPHDTILTLNQNYSNVNFVFQEANTKLAGRVLDARTEMPIGVGDVWVHLMNGFDNSYDVNTDGTFFVPLQLDSPTFGEIGVGGPFIEGHFLYPPSRKFQISPGDSLNFTFALYPADASIAGKIRINGTEVPQRPFRVFMTDTSVGTGQAYSDTNGGFSVPVSSMGQNYWPNLDNEQVDSMMQLGYTLRVFPMHQVSPGDSVYFNFVQGGFISGTVTDEQMTPMAGFVVVVRMMDGGNVWRDTTDNAGHYSVGPLPDGAYFVRVPSQHGMSGEFYNHKANWDSADPVQVASGSTQSDIDLTVHPAGFIAGVVQQSGQPVFGMPVEFHLLSQFGPQFYAKTKTDENGHYVSPPLPDGAYFVRAVTDTNRMAGVYYDNALNEMDADTVYVTVPDTTQPIDFMLQTPARLKGAVYANDPQGPYPLHNAIVQLQSVDNWQMIPAMMDSSGMYYFGQIPPGRYILMASAEGFQTQWYNSKIREDQADTLTLNEGDSLRIDFYLNPILENGVIAGVVRDAASEMGLPGLVVKAHAWQSDPWGGMQDYWRSDTTDAEGHYAIHVRDGRYEVYVPSQQGWVRQYFSHQFRNNGFIDQGGNVTPIDIVNASVADTVDFDLQRGGFISGHVSAGQDSSVEVDISVWDLNQAQVDIVSADSAGNYITHALPPGSYVVQFVPYWNYMPQYWNNKSTFDQADTIHVMVSDTVKHVDATLLASAHVEGRVLSIHGYPVNGIEIVALDTSGVDSFFAYSNEEGWFSFESLPQNAYIFKAFDPMGNWQTQYWDGVSTADSAQIVTPVPGQNIDLTFHLSNAVEGRVVFNEIMWMGSHRSRLDQWIELRNLTPDSVDISNWVLTIRDSLYGDRTLQFPFGSVIPAEGFFLISHFSADSSEIAVRPNIVWPELILNPQSFFVLLSTGHSYDPGTIWVDVAGDNGPVFAGDSLRFASMVRNMPPGDGSLPENWSTATTSHGWDPGATELGTPGVDNTLPVELADFSASVSDGAITLTWSTASESNNLGFEIQRKSDAPDAGWVKVGFVKGHGTSSSERVYSFTDGPEEVGTYFYRLKQVDVNGTATFSESVKAVLAAPKRFALKQNYPNPFNPTTTIPFAVPVKSRVTLAVYNVLGQKVAVLFDRVCKPGVYHVTWDTRNLSGREVGGGMYFVQMKAKGFHQTLKILLMR